MNGGSRGDFCLNLGGRTGGIDAEVRAMRRSRPSASDTGTRLTKIRLPSPKRRITRASWAAASASVVLPIPSAPGTITVCFRFRTHRQAPLAYERGQSFLDREVGW